MEQGCCGQQDNSFAKKEDIFDVEIAELLDWQVISEAASEELLFDILEEKKMYLTGMLYLKESATTTSAIYLR